MERFGGLSPGGLFSQFLTHFEIPLIGLNGDRVRSSRRKIQGCHSGLFSQVLHFAAFGDWSGVCCRYVGAMCEWRFV